MYNTTRAYKPYYIALEVRDAAYKNAELESRDDNFKRGVDIMNKSKGLSSISKEGVDR